MLVKINKNFLAPPVARIPLNNGRYAIVDPDWFDVLNAFTWYAKKSFSCWYAVRKETLNGSCYLVRMHRVVADTPPGLVCHHINRNPLDNRRLNLQNMSQFEHQKLYSWR